MTIDFDVLNQIARKAWDTAEKSGFHDDEKYRALVEDAIAAAHNMASIPNAVKELILESEKRTRLANGVNVPGQLMLNVSELSEALEDWRNPEMDPQVPYTADKTSVMGRRAPHEEYFDETAKPVGVGSELADSIIRACHLSKRMGIDIAYEVERKMKYNETRPHRHGGKRA